MKEVKLVIDLEGILKAYSTIDSEYDMKELFRSHDDLCYITILRHVLDKNIKIESELYSDEEKKFLENAIKNRMYEYFMFNDSKDDDATMHILQRSLSHSRNNPQYNNKPTRLLDDLMEPNIFIYNAEQGINMQYDMSKAVERLEIDDVNASLGTREYTLKIDDTKFTNLESLYRSTSMRLSREFFCSLENLRDLVDMNVLKKYFPEEEDYSLYKLYNTKHEKTNLPLVDYGLCLIFEKLSEIRALVKEIKAAEAASDKNALNEINAKIRKSFSPGDLGIAVSVYNNIEYITCEKEIHNSSIKALEYMINSEKVLEEKDGQKILKLSTDLRTFYKDHIASTGLEQIVKDTKDEIIRENGKKFSSYIQKEEECREKEAKLEEWRSTTWAMLGLYSRIERKKIQEIESLKCEINRLNYDHMFLLWKLGKEKRQLENIIKVKNSFGNLFLISLDQKKYLIEKMKELLEAHGVKVVVDGVETEPNRLKISEPPLNNQPPLEEQAPPHPASAERKIVSALKIVVSVSLVVLFIVSTIVFGYRIENRMKSTNN